MCFLWWDLFTAWNAQQQSQTGTSDCSLWRRRTKRRLLGEGDGLTPESLLYVWGLRCSCDFWYALFSTSSVSPQCRQTAKQASFLTVELACSLCVFYCDNYLLHFFIDSRWIRNALFLCPFAKRVIRPRVASHHCDCWQEKQNSCFFFGWQAVV